MNFIATLQLKCIKEGGIIMWHDYGRWGINKVSEYLHRLKKTGYNLQRIVGSHVALFRAENTSTTLSKPPA